MKREIPEYAYILRALMELPFQVGRNLLVDYLSGSYSNKSISKNRLDELSGFGSLSWDKGKIFAEIDRLISNGMIDIVPSSYNKFVKVLELTIRGRNEITNPTLEDKRLGNRVDFSESEISEEDRISFEKYRDFLEMYNEEQKKAIISSAKNLLCIAGAGSGKTTVLTKRIEFLVRHKGVAPEKILAITFTRKARLEMVKRLKELGILGAKVHTFNSFCERVLQRHGSEIYGRAMRVQSYGDKILAMNMAVASLGLDMDSVIDEYFSAGQKKFRTRSQLSNAFMNDCFSVMDYFKVSGKADYDWTTDVDVNERVNAERIYKITKYLREHMETQGLRDYSDQIIDAVNFLKKNERSIPNFEHVLVDEYQDVNALQIELLGLLNGKNFFAVGDPRQSIFGWRGSDVSYILNFEHDFGDAEIVHLKKNYRSLPGVVEFMNSSISEMGLPDLDSHLEGEAKIKVKEFANEDTERDFVVREIEASEKLSDVFVLARTNKILMELASVLKAKGIPHSVRADESAGKVNGEMSGVTLATIHAIKGLEAKRVFVIGATESNFPCKATDHPAVEMVKRDDYDKEEEERRLFYVAVSRAREELIVTHSKKVTYYITDEMRGIIGKKVGVKERDLDDGLLGELKSWRSVVAEELGVAAFVVFSNASLEEIAERKPKDAEELMKVKGVGPEKLMRYGEKILEIVEDFEE
ncbi:UvrD-helicase domain-containing protein [Methanococcoides sp. SA1]|nr:UvrD-helicase domain-containing protein [Methanococcoides sp. SA1]